MIPNNPLAVMRVLAGYATARAAAEKLGCSRIHLLNIERGHNGAGPALLDKISRLYRRQPEAVVRAIRRARKALLSRSLKGL